MKLIKFLFSIIMIFSQMILKAQPPTQVGNGTYLPPTIVAGTTIDNTRAAVTNIMGAGGGTSDQTLFLDGSHNYGAWAVGQKVLVILMSKSGGALPTRNWQMATVTSIGSGFSSLNVTNFAYTNWITFGNTSKIQVIMVPQYYDLTITTFAKLTCTAWDGYTGGVLTFVVYNTLTINSGGWLDVSAKGFSNVNSGGTGGTGGHAPGSVTSNTSVSGADGNSGLVVNFPIYPIGQGECYRDIAFSSVVPGGKGGAGGYTTPGADGILGTNPETRLVLPKSTGPKLLMMGNGGKQGNGGKGGAAGGNGGNGGNGYVGSTGTNGDPGSSGTQGGNGGVGGAGGGVIICFASNIVAPGGVQCVDISGTNGSNGDNGIAGGGAAGNGGNGGDGHCDNSNFKYYGYGAAGVKGLTGKGASGGSGGNGGSIGSFSIRTTIAIDNQLTLSNIKYNIGTGGSAGSGVRPVASAADGTDGCPEGDMSASCTYQPLCVKRKYDVYKCAGYEAFQVLGDMDHADDMQSYIKFTKTTYPYMSVSKKSGNAISADPKYYFCIYFKCSKLLVAYEDDDMEYNAVTATQCSENAFKELKGNVYWIKFKNNDCECDDLFKALADKMPTAPSYTATNDYGLQIEGGLTYLYGTVTFDNYQYTDYDNSHENGYFYDIHHSENRCEKDCNIQSSYKIEWTNLTINTPCECSPDESGSGPGGGGPNTEVYPDMPYVPEMWDNPDPGDDGDPGDPGEGDTDAINMGDFDPGDEDGLSELMGIETTVGAIGRHFVISPNPTGNPLILTSQQEISQTTVSIKIFDISGKLVLSQTNIKISNKAIISDISKLQAGTYFVQIVTGDLTEMLKFVKQ